MVYAKEPEYLTTSEEQKSIYLYLLDNNHAQFKMVRKKAYIESSYVAYANLQAMAEAGLIYSHPLLTEKEPGPKTVHNAKGLNISIKDFSKRALAWALLDFEELKDVPECESECIRLITEFAEREREYVNLFSGLSSYL